MKKSLLSKLSVVAVTVSLLSACGSNNHDNTPAPTVPDPDPVTDYQKMIDQAVLQNIPGLILSIDGPEVNFLGAAGLSDIDSQTSMQTFDVMPAGSAGKKATALLVVMLHDQGILDIDANISTWLPETLLSQIPNSDLMTLRQLLNHTAGLRDYLDPDTQEAWFEYGISTIDELKTDIHALQFILKKPAYFIPGEGFKYSNTGYILAGLILDSVLGEHHHNELRNRVLIPLGMNDTFYSGVEKTLGNPISGYILDDGEMLNTKSFYDDVGVADAPLVSSVSDMSLLLRTIVTDTSILNDSMRNLILGDENLIEYQAGKYYGMGVFKETINGTTVYHHGGDEAGYQTTNMYFLELDTTVTMFANCNSYEACISQRDALVQSIMVTLFE